MFQLRLVGNSSVHCQNGRLLVSEYYLLTGKCRTDGITDTTTYGIKCELRQDGKLVDSSTVEDISPLQKNVENLILLLQRNSVTPVTLKDVIEDYIACNA